MLTVRTFYYKVTDMREAVDWWSKVFGLVPHKDGETYSEFKFESIRIGFVLNSWGEKYEGNRGVIMLNADSEAERDALIQKAITAGGKVLSDNRATDLKSAAILDPSGNEIELGSLAHD